MEDKEYQERIITVIAQKDGKASIAMVSAA